MVPCANRPYKGDVCCKVHGEFDPNGGSRVFGTQRLVGVSPINRNPLYN